MTSADGDVNRNFVRRGFRDRMTQAGCQRSRVIGEYLRIVGSARNGDLSKSIVPKIRYLIVANGCSTVDRRSLIASWEVCGVGASSAFFAEHLGDSDRHEFAESASIGGIICRGHSANLAHWGKCCPSSQTGVNAPPPNRRRPRLRLKAGLIGHAADCGV